MIKLLYFSWILSITVSAQAINRDVNTNCGGSYSSIQGSISSPSFGVSNYQPDTECTWKISVPEGMVIQLDFQTMDIEEESQCAFDGVILYDDTPGLVANISNYSNNKKYLGNTRFCGSDRYPSLISKTNRVGVIFYADSDSQGQGFQLEWQAVPTPGENVFNCTFEQGLCNGWKNDDSPHDQFNWTLNKMDTSTEETGPTNDHTVQNKNGKYLYIETSLPQDNDIAILESPPVTFETDQLFACLSFWYHMHGETVDKLLVAKNTEEFPVWWMKTGPQGNQWQQASVQVQGNASTVFQVVFIGTKGPGFKGDIAIDDVTITAGSCLGKPDNNIEGVPLSQLRSENDSSDQELIQPPSPTEIICAAELYRCISGTTCIPRVFLCDGRNDCPEHDDEIHCQETTSQTTTEDAMNGGSTTQSNDSTTKDRIQSTSNPKINMQLSATKSIQSESKHQEGIQETTQEQKLSTTTTNHQYALPTRSTFFVGQRPFHINASKYGAKYFQFLSGGKNTLPSITASQSSILSIQDEAQSNTKMPSNEPLSPTRHQSSTAKESMEGNPTMPSKINNPSTTSGTRPCQINSLLVLSTLTIFILRQWGCLL